MFQEPRKLISRLAFAMVLSCLAASVKALASSMPTHASFDINSHVLKESRHVNVYTPPDYDSRPILRYQVLYMLDGGLQEDFMHVAADIDTMIRAGQIDPMIVIGIENIQRRRDMTGPSEVASDRKIAPQIGGSATFRAFIADELMPQVRDRYRTDGRTAIVGESLAGLFVVETFFTQPRLFDTYIALSPSLWWNNEALVHTAKARLNSWPTLTRRLYLASASDDDIDHAMETLKVALREAAPKGLTWFDEPWPDLHHSDIYRRASPAVFRKLFPRTPH